MDKYRILHIIKDDKFFEGTFACFEKEEYLTNTAVLEVKDVKDYHFRRIKDVKKVHLLDRKSMSMKIQEGEYDALFFHSMPAERYEYIKWIPKNKVVIWWCWGYELYHSVQGLKPIVKVPLFKPMTRKIQKEIIGGGVLSKSKKIFINLLLSLRYRRWQQMMIKRVDYFQPVIPLEYQLMCSKKGFHAKEFYFPNSVSSYHVDLFSERKINGDLLIGNSQSPGNNHLDVWETIKDKLPSGRRVIFPINYMGDQEYAREISNRIQSNEHNLLFIRDFLPRDEYFNLINGCSYAVFGVMRQQAMGNIFQCLKQGVKLFLYRDSIVYQCLKEYGFVVFTIEDIDEGSFALPLTAEENRQNEFAMNKYRLYIENVTKNSFNEILKKKN